MSPKSSAVKHQSWKDGLLMVALFYANGAGPLGSGGNLGELCAKYSQRIYLTTTQVRGRDSNKIPINAKP
jgi:hypothetical protein